MTVFTPASRLPTRGRGRDGNDSETDDGRSVRRGVDDGALGAGNRRISADRRFSDSDGPLPYPAGIPREVLAEAQAVVSGIYAAAGVKIVWIEPSPAAPAVGTSTDPYGCHCHAWAL